MKAKTIMAVLVLSAFLAVFASAQTVNQDTTQGANQVAGVSNGADVDQNINQRANQQAFAANNTTINQTLNQRAQQIAIGSGNVSQTTDQSGSQFASGGNASQNINQTGYQYATGSNITQNIYQNASQTTWNIQNYFTTEQRVELTSEQRMIITTRAEDFLVLYPQSRAFVMPITDFQTIVAEGNENLIVLDVSATGTATIPAGFDSVIRIPLADLANRIESIPADATVVVISDNDVNSAVAMTLLRMYGYNAWILPVGSCGWQGAATTGTALSSGLTSQTQTVDGVTTGQTTGTVSRTNF